MISRLLAEAGARVPGGGPVSVQGRGLEAAADWGNLKSPESYLGYDRAGSFASPGGMVPDGRHVYAAPARLALNQWALAGDWTVEGQPATLHAPGGRIAIRFHARDLHLLMGPPAVGRRCASASCSTEALRPTPTGATWTRGRRQGGRAAAVPAGPPAGSHRRPPVRDRVPGHPGVQAFAFTFG